MRNLNRRLGEALVIVLGALGALAAAPRSTAAQSERPYALRGYLAAHLDQDARVVLDTRTTSLIGRLVGTNDSVLVLYGDGRRSYAPIDRLRSLAFLNEHDHRHALFALTVAGGTAGGAAAVILRRRSIKRAGIVGFVAGPFYAACGEVVGMLATYNMAAHWLAKPASWDPVPLDSLRRVDATPP